MIARFGFKMIDALQKTKLVKELFDSVSGKYDLMNDCMSCGVHRLWKKEFIKHIALFKDLQIIDCACGSGDLTRLILKNECSLQISAVDLSQKMLDLCEAKCLDANLFQGVDFVQSEAEKLPFEDESFDRYVVGFGIRNFTDINKALQEAYRVLRPGGHFVCLEFAHVENAFFEKFYDFYLQNVLLIMGDLIADDEDSYRYLVESIKTFPKQEEFASMIAKAGFAGVKFVNLSGGIVAIHKGFKK